MKILVAGGNGFVGSHLCAELADRGHDVTALSRSTDDDLPAGVDHATGDVTAYDSIASHVEGQDAVVNFVALSPLFRPSDGEEQHFRVHLEGTQNLVQAAEEGGADRFLQQSALGADPDGPTHYLRAKGEAERVVRESPLAWTVLRPSIIFGDDGEFVRFTKLLSPPYLTPMPGGGRTPFQPIWVEDFAPIAVDTLEGDDHVGETYEIGGPEELMLADVARLAHRADGRDVNVVPVPDALSKAGLRVAGAVPKVPFGPDQYRALQVDNTVSENDVSAFGVDEADLRTLHDYLDAQ